MSGSGVAEISIARSGQIGAVSITGRANVACSPVFKNVVEHLRSESIDRIFLYLGSCVLMDSTFLGVLAQQGVALMGKGSERGTKIVLVTPSERVRDLIENLGVLDCFDVVDAEPEIDFVFQSVSMEPECDLQSLTRTSLEAHRTLISLNEENRARFEAVTSLLEKELGEDVKSNEGDE